jgi:quercetin 2,3-dioxygenase
MKRRPLLGALASSPLWIACGSDDSRALVSTSVRDVVKRSEPLAAQWPTLDPFLFCAHHDDAYPAGNGAFGPEAPLEGRNIGSDFAGKDGWNMYHGSIVPGFPQHPHRGFETVTIVRTGLVDHSDSLGAAARFGPGDVQWLTAGGGIVHAEMFPLLQTTGPNPLELFQIWMNLPSYDKMTAPHFSMLWKERIPSRAILDANGRSSVVTVIAGRFDEVTAAEPPPKSWASQGEHDVAIWTIKLSAGAELTLPPAKPGANRMIYFFVGSSLRVGTRTFDRHVAVEVQAEAETILANGDADGEVLVLSAMPIGEPVARRGPFVMNTDRELRQAQLDYQATRFGGWPWPAHDPVHDVNLRFARHADGRVENAG